MPSFITKVRNQETIAAIDLGSNALRAIIVRKAGNDLEVIKNLREPLRLGEDVFTTGMISKEKMDFTEEAFIRLFHAFTEHHVTDVCARATSAMRESKNARELIERVFSTTGIEIETIKGIEEARLIFEAVKGEVPLGKKTGVLMDIGGGSTEIIVVKSGKILRVHSFNVGTVRLIRYEDPRELAKIIKAQVHHMQKFIELHLGKERPQFLVGTGGNLRRIGKIRKKILRKESSEMALAIEIDHMEGAIFSMSYIDRIRRLELDQNRADVILPAIMLTQQLMKTLKMEKIHLPKVGLKEGIILSMLERPPRKFVLKD